MNKSVYVGVSLVDIRKTVIYEFQYDYAKPKYDENVKLCYMDTDSFTVHVKTDDIYKDIPDVKTRSNTSIFELDRPLPKEKNKKVVGLIKDKLGGQITKKICWIKIKNVAI